MADETITDQDIVDALADGDLFVADDLSDASTTKSVSASQIATYLGSKDLSNLATPATARANLGLGSMATQAASAVAITGGVAELSLTDTTIVSTTWQNVAPMMYGLLDWQPASDTATAVRFGMFGHCQHTTATNVTTAAHYGGGLFIGQKNNATGTDAFVIGVEGRVGAVDGTITVGASVVATFDTNAENAGTIGIGAGFYLPPQADDGHISAKFSAYLADADWEFRSEGIVNANSTLQQRGVGVEGASAWGVYESVSATPVLESGFNVASLVDGGTGIITVVYTTALAAGYKSVTASASGGTAVVADTNLTIGFNCYTYTVGTATLADMVVCFNVHGGF